jgi:hypothetical protein
VDKDLIEKLIVPVPNTPNILDVDHCESVEPTRRIAVAPAWLRGIAQACIDLIPEHRHLRAGRVLLLVEWSDAAAAKLEAGEPVVIGKAAKATAKERLLTNRPPESQQPRGKDEPDERADFTVKLCGDWLDRVGAGSGEEGGLAKAAALVDHELLHCSARIAGKWVPADEAERRAAELGEAYIETRDDVDGGPEGMVLLRYYAMKNGAYAWKMRRHDLEEFLGVAARHGAWDRQLGRMIDVLEKDRDPVSPGVA